MVAVFGSAKDPIPCASCDGAKEVPFRRCGHSGDCPCGPGYMRCPACLRTPGYKGCDICGERPGIDRDADGDALCVNCLAAAADEKGAA